MTQRELERKAKENKQKEIEKIETSLKEEILEVLNDIKNILEEDGKEFNLKNVAEELFQSFASSIEYADEFTDIMLLSRLKKLWKTAGTDWREFAY